jgi:excisionase family DNA binding protein
MTSSLARSAGSASSGASSSDSLLTITDAAVRLGVGERMVRRLITERRITFVHIGKHVRIPESVIDELIDHGTTTAKRPAKWGAQS